MDVAWRTHRLIVLERKRERDSFLGYPRKQASCCSWEVVLVDVV